MCVEIGWRKEGSLRMVDDTAHVYGLHRRRAGHYIAWLDTKVNNIGLKRVYSFQSEYLLMVEGKGGEKKISKERVLIGGASFHLDAILIWLVEKRKKTVGLGHVIGHPTCMSVHTYIPFIRLFVLFFAWWSSAVSSPVHNIHAYTTPHNTQNYRYMICATVLPIIWCSDLVPVFLLLKRHQHHAQQNDARWHWAA